MSGIMITNANELNIDFHLHSTASDGQYSPAQLVELVKKNGISAMALTDHDTVRGIKEAADKARELKVPFIAGIEISSMEFEEIHIVGLGIDYENPMLIKATEKFMTERANRGTVIIDYLKTVGVNDITLEEVLEIAGDGSVGRPHFAEALVRHGYVNTRQAAFDRYIDSQSFHEATDRKLPSTEEAIKLIHEAGGLAILAHPGLIKKGKEKQKEFIGNLVDQGIDGIEAIYSKHSLPQMKFYLEQARLHNLLISCGSDFHGEKVKPKVKLGMKVKNSSFIEELQKLQNKLEKELCYDN